MTNRGLGLARRTTKRARRRRAFFGSPRACANYEEWRSPARVARRRRRPPLSPSRRPLAHPSACRRRCCCARCPRDRRRASSSFARRAPPCLRVRGPADESRFLPFKRRRRRTVARAQFSFGCSHLTLLFVVVRHHRRPLACRHRPSSSRRGGGVARGSPALSIFGVDRRARARLQNARRSSVFAGAWGC